MRTRLPALRGAFLPLATVALLLAAGLGRARAAPPPPDELSKAEAEQDRALSEAERGGSMARVVVTYESRLGRQATVLNRYLYGRALFHNGDKAAALREMRAVAEAEPDFWQAELRLAFLYLDAKNLTLARQHGDRARTLAPDDPTVLMVVADVGAQSKDWDLALSALTRLDALSPKDPRVLKRLADAHRSKGDWASAYTVLRTLRTLTPSDGVVRAIYAHAAFRAGHLDEAAVEFEALTTADPDSAPLYLQELQQICVQGKRWPQLARVLERLRPFVKAEERASLDQTVAELKAGRVPGERPQPPDAAPAPTAEEQTLALIERCLSPDVAVRRAALQDFHAAELGWIPKAILVRYHPQEEPDPECRAWVVRLVGALKSDLTAKVPGHALQDPESLVRCVAAGALGEIGTPAGILYLVASVADMPLAADAAERVVQEYNAARLALSTLTGFDDLEIGAPRWVPAAGLEASRRRWDAWFDSPPGVEAKQKAIADLVRTGETHPEWYLLVQLYSSSPEVARAAYDALLQRSTQPSTDAVAQRLWPSFPRLRSRSDDGRELTAAETLDDMRARVKVWWTQWLAARTAEAK